MKNNQKDDIQKMVDYTSKILKIHNDLRKNCPEYFNSSNFQLLHNHFIGSILAFRILAGIRHDDNEHIKRPLWADGTMRFIK